MRPAKRTWSDSFIYEVMLGSKGLLTSNDATDCSVSSKRPQSYDRYKIIIPDYLQEKSGKQEKARKEILRCWSAEKPSFPYERMDGKAQACYDEVTLYEQRTLI